MKDYYMVTPQAMTFWGHEKIGAFEAPEEGPWTRLGLRVGVYLRMEHPWKIAYIYIYMDPPMAGELGDFFQE